MAYLIRTKYPLSGFNYHLSDANVANFNKIHRTVSEQQLSVCLSVVIVIWILASLFWNTVYIK